LQRAIIALVGLTLTAGLASGARDVPIVNAGFEDRARDGGPAGWRHTVFDQVQGRVTLSTERAHSGKQSVRLEAQQGEGCVLVATPVKCAPGDELTTSCWLFNEVSHASLYLKFLRGGYQVNDEGSFEYAICHEVGKWTRVEVKATAPWFAEGAVISLYVPMAAHGAHYFDDVALSLTAGERRPKVLDIGTAKELFCDEALVADRRNVSLVLHPGKKHPGNPLLRPEKPWEGWRSYVYGNVVYDDEDGLFKMWYITAGPRYFTCYATSKDGLHWDKPALDLPEWRQYGQGNNIVGIFHLASVIKDEADPDPQKRWKMICWDPTPLPDSKPNTAGRRAPYGYATRVSPDGIRWKHYSKGPIAPGGDVITGLYDERSKQYIAFPKVHPRIGRFSRRSFAVMTSRDFDEWTKPVFVLGADKTDDAGIQARVDRVRPILQAPDDPDLMRTEFYGLGLLPTESVYLAFVWVFSINNKSLWSTNQDGPIDLQLAASRNLMNWHRCGDRKPIVESGQVRSEHDADWDSGMITTVSRPLIVGDEIWLYYGGHNITHGDSALYKDDGRRGTEATAGIGLATWRLDGLMSAHSGQQPGTLTTGPLSFSGDHLVINADADEGEVRVALLNEQGQPFPGFSRDDCDPFRGDAVRHTVTWQDRADCSALAGRPVQVRFHLTSADLYSYAFRQGAARPHR